MFPFIILALFPNLQNYHPSEFFAAYDYLNKSGNCVDDISTSKTCIADINAAFYEQNQSPLLPFWSRNQLSEYSNQLIKSNCFKNITCQDIEPVKTIYDKYSFVLNTIFDKSFTCFTKNHKEMSRGVEECSRSAPSLSDHLMRCTKPMIEKMECTEEQKIAVQSAIDDSIVVSNLMSNLKTDKSEHSSNGVPQSSFTFVFIATVFLSVFL